MEKRYYVYVLFDLNENISFTLNEINQSFLYKPYYVGKGTKNRINAHKRIKNTKHKKDAKTKSLINQGFKFEDFSRILIDNLTESDAYLLEEQIIKSIGLDNLLNITPGGIGGFGNYRGKNYIEIYGEEKAKEVAKKISESNTGKIRNEESILKHSNTLKQKFKEDENFKISHSNGQRGKKMSETFSEKQSERLINLSYEERYGNMADIIKEKQSIAAKGKKQTEEHKLNAAKARAKYLWNIEHNGIKCFNLLRSEFIEIVGKCPFKVKDAVKVYK